MRIDEMHFWTNQMLHVKQPFALRGLLLVFLLPKLPLQSFFGEPTYKHANLSLTILMIQARRIEA